jgi:hypothetical protein
MHLFANNPKTVLYSLTVVGLSFLLAVVFYVFSM